MEDLLKEIADLSVEPGDEVLLHGGDPCLHPEIVQIARAAAQRARVILLTPGVSIRLDSARSLAGIVERFRVRLPALQRDLYARVTGRDMVARAEQGLSILTATGARLEVEIPVNRVNLVGVRETLERLGRSWPSLDRVILSFHDHEALYRERDALWSLLGVAGSGVFPWPIMLDRSSAPPPCSAPSQAMFEAAEALFFDVLMPAEGRAESGCTGCLLEPYCHLKEIQTWKGVPRQPFGPGYPGHDVPCVIPWLEMDLSEGNGFGVACCTDWVKIDGVSAYTHGVQNAFNWKGLQVLRRAVFRDRRLSTCKTACPYMHSDSRSLSAMLRSEYPGIRRLAAISVGAETVDYTPLALSLGVTTYCNLDCVMCRVRGRHKRNEAPSSLYEELLSLAKGIRKLSFTGGEPLTSRRFLDFLERLDKARFPALTAILITNGTLLTKGLVSRLSRSVMDNIVISVNAATRTTYSRINVGGDWDTLMKNLGDLADMRRHTGWPKEVVLSFVILRANFQEARAFVHLARSFDAQVRFLTDNSSPSRSARSIAASLLKAPPEFSGWSQWFFYDHRLCRQAVDELSAAVKDMEAFSYPHRLAEARAVVKSLAALCW